MDKEKADKILSIVFEEFKAKDLLDEEAVENLFGCKFFDEISERIQNET